SVLSVLEVVWGFLNDGVLPAVRPHLTVERQIEDGTFAHIASQQWDDLKRGQELFPQISIPIPFVGLPAPLSVRARFGYSSEGIDYSEIFTARWDPLTNNWQLL